MWLVGCVPPPEEPAKAAKSPIARYQQGKQLYRDGQYLKAISVLDAWLKANAKHVYEPAALYYLARSQTKARCYGAAKTTYERLTKDYAATDWGKFASEDLRAFEQKEPHLPEYRPQFHWWHPWDWFGYQQPIVKEFEAARAEFDAGQYEKALAAFRKLGEDNPASPLAPGCWYFTGRSQEQLRKAGEARETYEHLAASFGDSPWKGLAEERLRRLKK